MPESKQRIYLIRHGETEWTLSGKHTGVSDIPLTENGKAQGAQIRSRLNNHPFAAVFCSPLKRARQTCECAGLSSLAKIDPRLVEWNYGIYEGLTTAVIQEKKTNWNIFKDGAPQGESPEDIYSRGKLILNSLKEIKGDVALISHGHFLRALTTIWLDLPLEKGILFSLFPGSISLLGFEKEQQALILWNETSHLNN